jgi:hypothetical protein
VGKSAGALGDTGAFEDIGNVSRKRGWEKPMPSEETSPHTPGASHRLGGAPSISSSCASSAVEPVRLTNSYQYAPCRGPRPSAAGPPRSCEKSGSCPISFAWRLHGQRGGTKAAVGALGGGGGRYLPRIARAGVRLDLEPAARLHLLIRVDHRAGLPELERAWRAANPSATERSVHHRRDGASQNRHIRAPSLQSPPAERTRTLCAICMEPRGG